MSSVALDVGVDGDTQTRLRIDAGGKLTWGSGTATGDTTLYRSTDDTLYTDDVFTALSGLVTLTTSGVPTQELPNGAIAIDTTNHVFYFRSNSTWNLVSGGDGASVTVNDTAPVDPTAGDLWFESDTRDMFIYFSSAWLQLTDADAMTVFNIDGGNELLGILEASVENHSMLVFNGGGI